MIKIITLVIVYTGLHFLSACKTNSDVAIKKSFRESHAEPKVIRTDTNGPVLRYVEVDMAGENAPAVIFIHGAPGGADAYFDYLKDSALTSRFVLVAIDRLGYGGSNRGRAETSIIRQAESIYPVINRYLEQGRKVYLVGHSYGGAIAAAAAMTYGVKVDGMVLLAPAIDPDREKMFWVANLGKYPPTRWITPKGLRVATDEKMAHAQALRTLVNDWGKIQSSVIYVHGKEDKIVPFENFEFAEEKLAHVVPEMIAIEGENHFLPWAQYDLVVDAILRVAGMEASKK